MRHYRQDPPTAIAWLCNGLLPLLLSETFGFLIKNIKGGIWLSHSGLHKPRTFLGRGFQALSEGSLFWTAPLFLSGHLLGRSFWAPPRVSYLEMDTLQDASHFLGGGVLCFAYFDKKHISRYNWIGTACSLDSGWYIQLKNSYRSIFPTILMLFSPPWC